MSYDKNHTKDDCDKCGKRVGKKKLFKVPFLYLDRNDKVHKDYSNHPSYKDYKQYYVCGGCIKKTE